MNRRDFGKFQSIGGDAGIWSDNSQAELRINRQKMHGFTVIEFQ